MASVKYQPRPVIAMPLGKSQATNVTIKSGLRVKPTVMVAILLGAFFLLQSRIPMRTAVQIGADEGFELAKATLCLKGYQLYSEIWCDHPPLHTWLITQAIKLQSDGPLTPSLSPSEGVSAGRVKGNGDRRDALSYYSPLGPRLVTVGFAVLLLTSVFLMALHVAGVAQTSKSAVSQVSKPANGTTTSAQPTRKSAIQQVGKPGLQPLWAAAITTVLLMASPGFLELSSSCMMEIPALAPAVTALCVLMVGRQRKWHGRELFAGVLFGIAFGMKLLGLMLLPLAALIIWMRCRSTLTPLTPSLSPSDGERVSDGRVRDFQAFIRFIFPRGVMQSLAIVCVTTAVTFVVLDWLIDGGAFLRHFRQSWAAHFAPAVSFEHGSPGDHRFSPSLLLKNWDLTIPALVGIVVLLRRAFHKQKPLTPSLSPSDGEREEPTRLGVLLPVIWLALVLGILATHTPWWSYYYVHIAIPLAWCAAAGFAFVGSAVADKLRNHGVVRGTFPRPRQAGSTVLLKQAGRAVPLLLFALAAAAWMGARVYLQIVGIRKSPQTYYALVLKEIARFKPFTEWIYADNLTYSFHAGIPFPPQLAVVSLKRLWSGELTIAQVGDEVRKFKPGVIALRNDSRELPFQDLLDTEYRLVYQDPENRLYAHRSIASKADQ